MKITYFWQRLPFFWFLDKEISLESVQICTFSTRMFSVLLLCWFGLWKWKKTSFWLEYVSDHNSCWWCQFAEWKLRQNVWRDVKLSLQPSASCIYIPHHYRPQTTLRKGNVFTSVCQSFCSRGRVPAPDWQCMLGYTPGRHTPTPADSYCCRRYASYWNAFLLKFHSCLRRPQTKFEAR